MSRGLKKQHTFTCQRFGPVDSHLVFRSACSAASTQVSHNVSACLQQPANAEASQASPQPPEARRPGRIDGTGLSRETLFGGSKKQGSWLSENDIDFFTGGALSRLDAAVVCLASL